MRALPAIYAAASLAAAAAVLTACEESSPHTPAPVISPSTGTYEFTVRGAFVTMDPEARTVTLRNEAIPEYPLPDAQGLDPVDYSYVLDEGLTLSPGLTLAAPVEFRFSVDPDLPDLRTLLELSPLPPDTRLDFACLPRDYTVRGEIIALPGAGGYDYLTVRHEAIPEFIGAEGKLGMHAMIMAFPTGDGVSLAKLKPGDKAVIEFRVIYGENHHLVRYFVTSIETLDPATELHFAPADQDAADHD